MKGKWKNLSKSKLIMYTIIGIMSLILVYVMFIQFRIINETDTEEIEFMREAELRELLSNYKSNYQDAKDELIETQGKIDEYKQAEKSEEETIALLENEIKDAEMKLGMTDVKGEGSTITLSDTEGYTVGYSDLLYLINELIYAGAEAISINDERIVAMTDLASVGNFILINGNRTTSPFNIRVIGDTTKLQSALSIKGGYIDTYGELFSITAETGETIIRKHSGQITLIYAKD